MEFREVVRRRRMVRRYADEPVDPAVVDRMLEHAQRAPNAGFSQGWAFLVLFLSILSLPRGLFSEVRALALFRRDMAGSPWARRRSGR